MTAGCQTQGAPGRAGSRRRGGTRRRGRRCRGGGGGRGGVGGQEVARTQCIAGTAAASERLAAAIARRGAGTCLASASARLRAGALASRHAVRARAQNFMMTVPGSHNGVKRGETGWFGAAASPKPRASRSSFLRHARVVRPSSSPSRVAKPPRAHSFASYTTPAPEHCSWAPAIRAFPRVNARSPPPRGPSLPP